MNYALTLTHPMRTKNSFELTRFRAGEIDGGSSGLKPELSNLTIDYLMPAKRYSEICVLFECNFGRFLGAGRFANPQRIRLAAICQLLYR